MDKMKIKEDVLQQLIDLMDSKETESLKAKSPKFMKVETNDPEMAEAIKPEMPMMKEEKEEEANPEDLKRLLEMYANLNK